MPLRLDSKTLAKIHKAEVKFRESGYNPDVLARKMEQVLAKLPPVGYKRAQFYLTWGMILMKSPWWLEEADRVLTRGLNEWTTHAQRIALLRYRAECLLKLGKLETARLLVADAILLTGRQDPALSDLERRIAKKHNVWWRRALRFLGKEIDSLTRVEAFQRYGNEDD